MEAISQVLQPYKEIIGQVAGILTFFHMLSAMFMLNDIRKKKTTAGTSAIPFLGGFVLTILSLKFGAILRDDAMIRINFLGFALNTGYVVFYYFYTPNEDKNRVWGQIGLAGAFAGAVLAYGEYEDPDKVEFRFGLIFTGFLFALVASPFLSLGDVIRNKSTEGLPFPIILSGTVISFMWLLYGFCLNNGTIVFQNGVMLALSAVQLSLFVIYPSTPVAKKSKSSKKTN